VSGNIDNQHFALCHFVAKILDIDVTTIFRFLPATMLSKIHLNTNVKNRLIAF